MDEKQAVTFALFSTFLNPQRDTLTYSALGNFQFCCHKEYAKATNGPQMANA